MFISRHRLYKGLLSHSLSGLMNSGEEIAYYEVPPPTYTLVVLTIVTTICAFQVNLLFLATIPTLYLGIVASHPNFNLISLIIPVLVVIVGSVIGMFHNEVGQLISISAFVSWLSGSIEKAIRTRPVYKIDMIAESNQ